MKLHRFLLPVVILLVVLFLSYPAIPQRIKQVLVTNPVLNDKTNAVPVIGSPSGPKHPVWIKGTVNNDNARIAPSNIVSLWSNPGTPRSTHCGANQHVFLQTLPDAKQTDTPFTPPSKKVLVVTGFQYRFVGSARSEVLTVERSKAVGKDRETLTNNAVFQAVSDNKSGSVTMPTGVVVAHDTYLCLRGGPTATIYVTAQGYLAEDN